MAKILLVEDDEDLRNSIADHLNRKGHTVVGAPDGKAAKEVAFADEFQIIISDVQMPFVNGIQLLEWIREHSKIPFILMTGFSHLLETHKAANLGADGFLTKPFKNNSLLEIIEELLNPKFNEDIDSVRERIESYYCGVPIEQFIAKPKIDFDLYLRLAAARYIKIANSGETLDVKQVSSYKTGGILTLHIKKEDLSKLIASGALAIS